MLMFGEVARQAAMLQGQANGSQTGYGYDDFWSWPFGSGYRPFQTSFDFNVADIKDFTGLLPRFASAPIKRPYLIQSQQLQIVPP